MITRHCAGEIKKAGVKIGSETVLQTVSLPRFEPWMNCYQDFLTLPKTYLKVLSDESLVRCKESSRSILSFMEENTKFWKRIITKYLDNLYSHPTFDKSWESLMDTKQTRPEMIT